MKLWKHAIFTLFWAETIMEDWDRNWLNTSYFLWVDTLERMPHLFLLNCPMGKKVKLAKYWCITPHSFYNWSCSWWCAGYPSTRTCCCCCCCCPGLPKGQAAALTHTSIRNHRNKEHWAAMTVHSSTLIYVTASIPLSLWPCCLLHTLTVTLMLAAAESRRGVVIHSSFHYLLSTGVTGVSSPSSLDQSAVHHFLVYN